MVRSSARVSVEEVLGLVVMVARLEQHTRQLYTRMLADRERSWAQLRQECVDRLVWIYHCHMVTNIIVGWRSWLRCLPASRSSVGSSPTR